jgi:hypothetical protein
LGPLGQSVQRLVQVAGFSARADGHERQQASIARRVGSLRSSKEAADLAERVVQDLW